MHLRPLFGVGSHHEGTGDELGPLSHSRQPQPLVVRQRMRVEPATVVVHGERKPVVFTAKRDLHRLGGGVATRGSGLAVPSTPALRSAASTRAAMTKGSAPLSSISTAACSTPSALSSATTCSRIASP